MIYELYKLEDLDEKTVKVSYLGIFKTVSDAVKQAKRTGEGRYRVCDSFGDVRKFKLRRKDGISK